MEPMTVYFRTSDGTKYFAVSHNGRSLVMIKVIKAKGLQTIEKHSNGTIKTWLDQYSMESIHGFVQLKPVLEAEFFLVYNDVFESMADTYDSFTQTHFLN
jgi:glutamine synthetase